MVVGTARPHKHPKTGVFWFRKAVPKALQAVVGKLEELRSLRTKDPVKAHASIAAEVEAHWKALRSPAQVLTNREVTALAGTYYSKLTYQLSDEPGSVTVWDHWLRLDQEVREAGKLEQWWGSTVDDLLRKRGLHVDLTSRARLLDAISSAVRQAGEHLKKNAAGDYSPDPAASRFPEWKPKGAPQALPTTSGKTSLTGILADWWKEAQATGRKPSTYESYSNTVDGFVAFLGHDDATQVTPERVVGFNDHRLASINPRTKKPISPKTVKDSDLSALKTLFGWAVSNHRLPGNPAVGITIKLGKRRARRPKGFTDEEAEALLQAADAHQQGQEQPKTFAAKRWVPWLCAYTGARVGEVAQLRKQDVRKAGDHWVIHITPEAGTVKTDQARDVVLHEHLVAKGFPTFVAGAKSGHLFLTSATDGDVLGPLQGLKNRLAEAARATVKDPRVQPNHGWRHRFKTVARSVAMDGRVVDAIQGHAPRTAGDDYGDVTVAAMALALAKFPRQA
jgi:integrase